MGKSNSNNFIKHGSILAIASVISRIIGLLYRSPMTAIIGDEANGVYSFAFEVYSIALILSSYSMPLAVSKLLSAKFARKEYKNGYAIFRHAMIFSSASGLLMALIIFFAAPAIENISGYKGLTLPLRVLAPTIFIVAIVGTLRGFFQSRKTMIPTSISQLLEQIINAIVSVAAAAIFVAFAVTKPQVVSGGAAGGTMGTLFGAFFALVFLIFIYMAYKPRFFGLFKNDNSTKADTVPAIYKMLIVTIIPVILSQTVYQISGVIDGTLFGNLYKGDDTAFMYGLYSSKYRVLVNVPNAIASAMASSMIPALVSMWAVGNYKQFKSRLAASVKVNMVIAFPCAVGLMVLATPIMRLLFPTTDYIMSGRLLSWGAIAVVFYSLSTITNAALQGMDKMNRPVINSAISLAIHIVLVVLLLKFTRLGVYALVIGNVTFPLVVCILNWVAVAKHSGYQQEVLTTFVLPFGASLVMGGVCFGVNKLFTLIPGNSYAVNLLAVVVCMIVSIVVYFAVLFLTKGLTHEDMLNFPMGLRIERLAKKVRLMK